MLIFLHGEDSFRIHDRVDILRSGFKEKYDADGTSVESLLSDKIKPEDIRSRLLTQGLFTTKRFLVIRDVFNLSDQAAEAFEEAVTQTDQDTIVVATANEVPKKKSALKAVLQQADRIEEYALLNDAQVANWAKRQFKESGATIDADALTHVLQSIGNDLWSLHHVIQQLIHYTLSPDIPNATVQNIAQNITQNINRNITKADVELFVQSPLDDNIFHFSDALAERNTKRALQLLHDQMDSGANPFYIVSMLARQLSILIEMKETNGKGSKLHPYVIKKTQQHAQRFDRHELERMYQKIVEIDYAMKSTRHDPRLLLDTFVIEATR